MAEEDPFQGGDEAFEVMAPMLVEKLQVSYLAFGIPQDVRYIS
jgi:hypothetical protein